MAKELDTEELLDKIENAAHDYEARYHGCSRCVIRSLLDHLKLGDGSVFKAATPLAGGIAMRGETCGALVGGIMAIGLALANGDIEDENWMKPLIVGYRLWHRFEKEVGATSCRDIQTARFGRFYNLADVKEYEEFGKAGGYVECAKVVGKVARMAAQMILEQSGKK